MGDGVRTVSYGTWVRERPAELVWHARIANIRPDSQSAIAEEAIKYVGTPYNFWNFDLRDTAGFYCSKLAWLSIVTAVGTAPDDNMRSKRLLWYSPKQLLRSPHLSFLNTPGDYAIR